MAFWSVFNQRRDLAERESPDQITRGISQRPLPAIGSVIFIEVIPTDTGKLPSLFNAIVADVRGRNIIIGDVSAKSGQSSTLDLAASGAVVRVSFAADDHRYRFELRAGRRSLRALTRGLYSLPVPLRVDRVEQRRYFRMLLETPTWYRPDNAPTHWRRQGRIIDLSGGGMLLGIDDPVPAGRKLVVETPCGKSGHIIDMTATVVECTIRTTRTRKTYALRLRFVDSGGKSADGDREAVVAYVFEQQRLMLRARKLTLG